MTDEGERELNGTIAQIESISLPIVAAIPGFTFLSCYVDGNGETFVRRMPIVAWRIGGSFALPVTCEEDNSTTSNLIGTGVLQPDGQVACPYIAVYADEAEWRKEMDAEGCRELIVALRRILDRIEALQDGDPAKRGRRIAEAEFIQQTIDRLGGVQ
jgi:hypothetical protein